jgi:hypothetical protein
MYACPKDLPRELHTVAWQVLRTSRDVLRGCIAWTSSQPAMGATWHARPLDQLTKLSKDPHNQQQPSNAHQPRARLQEFANDAKLAQRIST